MFGAVVVGRGATGLLEQSIATSAGEEGATNVAAQRVLQDLRRTLLALHADTELAGSALLPRAAQVYSDRD